MRERIELKKISMCLLSLMVLFGPDTSRAEEITNTNVKSYQGTYVWDYWTTSYLDYDEPYDHNNTWNYLGHAWQYNEGAYAISFTINGKNLLRGWLTNYNGCRYYLAGGGWPKYVTGFYTDPRDKTIRYFAKKDDKLGNGTKLEDGAMAIGWFYSGNDKYYSGAKDDDTGLKEGESARNILLEIDGQHHLFASDGKLITSFEYDRNKNLIDVDSLIRNYREPDRPNSEQKSGETGTVLNTLHFTNERADSLGVKEESMLKPIIFGSTKLENNSDVDQTLTTQPISKAFTNTTQLTDTKGWKIGGGITQSFTYKFSAGIPGLVGGELSGTTELTVTGEYNATYAKLDAKSEVTTYTIPSQNIKVAPHSIAYVSGKLFEGTYTGTVTLTGDLSGRYTKYYENGQSKSYNVYPALKTIIDGIKLATKPGYFKFSNEIGLDEKNKVVKLSGTGKITLGVFGDSFEVLVRIEDITTGKVVEGKKFWMKGGKFAIKPNYWYQNDAGEYFHYDDNGKIQKGWKEIEGKKYYFEPSGEMVSGWKQIGDKKYYFEPSGEMVSDWKEIDEKLYRFNADGEMNKGILEWNNGKQRFQFDNTSGEFLGVMRKEEADEWKLYADKDFRTLKTGWVTDMDGIYYFENGKMQKDWKEIDGKLYRFNKDGKMNKGTLEWDNGKQRFQFDNTSGEFLGVMRKEEADEWKLYADKDFQTLKTDWFTDMDGIYYFENGKLKRTEKK